MSAPVLRPKQFLFVLIVNCGVFASLIVNFGIFSDLLLLLLLRCPPTPAPLLMNLAFWCDCIGIDM